MKRDFLQRFCLRVSVCVFMVMVVPGFANAQNPMFMQKNPLIGEVAPDFTLETLSGKKMSLKQARGDNGAIVFFWATWCPHCRKALQNLVQQKDKIEGQGIKLVIVDVEEGKGEVSAFLKKNNITMDMFLDPQGSLNEPYALIGVPTFIFINQKGIVRDVLHALPANYAQIIKSGS